MTLSKEKGRVVVKKTLRFLTSIHKSTYVLNAHINSYKCKSTKNGARGEKRSKAGAREVEERER